MLSCCNGRRGCARASTSSVGRAAGRVGFEHKPRCVFLVCRLPVILSEVYLLPLSRSVPSSSPVVPCPGALAAPRGPDAAAADRLHGQAWPSLPRQDSELATASGHWSIFSRSRRPLPHVGGGSTTSFCSRPPCRAVPIWTSIFEPASDCS